MAALVLALALAGPARGQMDFDRVPIDAVPVTDGVFMITGAGGNIGVSAGPDGVLIVDDQYAEVSERVGRAIEALGAGPVRFVLNTHWHRDHAGGNAWFAGRGALVLAHERARARMAAPQFSAFFDARTPAAPPAALPVLTYAEGLGVHVNGLVVEAEAVGPAHTDGDSIVWFRGADAVHLGDLYFNGLYPFIDLSSGGDVRGMLAAVDAILPRVGNATRVMPGHGPLGDRTSLVAYRDMLATVIARIDALHAAGRTLDEIVAARPTAEFDARWGGGFLGPERWVRLVHASLVGGAPR